MVDSILKLLQIKVVTDITGIVNIVSTSDLIMNSIELGPYDGSIVIKAVENDDYKLLIRRLSLILDNEKHIHADKNDVYSRTRFNVSTRIYNNLKALCYILEEVRHEER